MTRGNSWIEAETFNFHQDLIGFARKSWKILKFRVFVRTLNKMSDIRVSIQFSIQLLPFSLPVIIEITQKAFRSFANALGPPKILYFHWKLKFFDRANNKRKKKCELKQQKRKLSTILAIIFSHPLDLC